MCGVLCVWSILVYGIKQTSSFRFVPTWVFFLPFFVVMITACVLASCIGNGEQGNGVSSYEQPSRKKS